MKGASKVIMGATLVMVVTLAIVLGLVLVLLAELYCTLLLRRRRLGVNSSNAATAPATVAVTLNSTHPPQAQNHSDTPRSYAPGVLEAPRSLFYPAISSKEKCSQLHHFLQLHTQQSNSSPQHIGLIKTSPSPNSPTSPHQIGEIQIQISATNEEEPVVYISNPIYDNRVETPFETPDSSPSRLETGSGGSSGDDEEIGQPCSSSPVTPPLTPMKKLPAEASSVSLRDARSLGTSGSDSVSNNGLSSSSSGSPSTSPSW